MLQTELLRVRRREGRVHPLYLDAERHGELCSTLIEIFNTHVGAKKAWLESKLDEFESSSADFKLVRGLASLLLRRCGFRVKPNLAVEPKTARRVVFEYASPPPLSVEERSEVISKAAEKLGVSPQQLEEALWADRDSELILEFFTRPDPNTLIAEYNLELTRTLISRASRLRVYSAPEWKKVFLLAKRCGLMYQAVRGTEGFGIMVEGAYYTHNSNIYTDRLIAFFDGLLNLRDWRLVADVPTRSAKYTHIFELDSNTSSRLGFGYVGGGGGPPSFDSEVERRFYYAFRSLNSGWEILRESEPLVAGDEVFIPDFTLTREGIKVYVEIVGFWTKEYLERKARKLASLRGVDLIVVANRTHSATKIASVPGVVFFEGDVPLKPILDVLNTRHPPREEAPPVMDNLGEVVDVGILKRRLGSNYQDALKQLRGEGYIQLGSTLVKKSLFEQVASELKAAGKITYSDADRLCSAHGLNTQAVLEALGYRVKWLGLDPSSIVVEPSTQAT
ncbi:hypothetical protein B9Q09_00860 [Candidatus Marsarchaeota G2 archaeon ECH_B_SAG-C16]|uniref:DUF790 family protein n=3 Tax=Candidatus Marsarchaeota group 2 TaxID=2203771 RepID=A0A2R6CEU6_9ARCH|nr:MAG: hypothetical protein B9Q08_00010 [Candidatus Marsarchaeota G2 archaeon ECH_B_SAG-M15]PSN97371.1 MAG: hypothetical protein B9Q09_00860 [Candidatus Marsarchaeota G2 archaeon ECH_B_SAG-C16]PSO09341.1 MAG: hypothetical protein B9Q04_00905 [Candidatus Marsarchaeota G2 archaeon BE_D]